MQETLINQGINLMIYGMSTVFVFLTILVFATSLMSRLVKIVTPDQPAVEADESRSDTTDFQMPSPQIMEAVKQAIASHRQK